MENKTVQVTFYLAALLLIVSMERLYRDRLYAVSLTYIKEIQAHTNHAMIDFMMLVSDIGILLLFGVMIGAYLFCSKSRAYYYTVGVSMNLYLMSIGKMGYHEPRPYMVDDDI